MDIGKTIRKIRTRKGMKAGDLANRLGVSKSYISRIEREHRRINTDLLERIGQVLDVPLTVLLGGESGAQSEGLHDELEVLRDLLLENVTLDPGFVSVAVSWLSELVFPTAGAFETAGSWETGLVESLGDRDPALVRLAGRFQDLCTELLPTAPRPQTPYGRFREGSAAVLRDLPVPERVRIVSLLLPSLLRARKSWPDALRKAALLKLPPPPADPPVPTGLVLPRLSGNGSGDAETVELLPARDLSSLKAVVVDDAAMSPKYEPGDVIVFTASRAARNGDRAVVGLKEGGWLCRIYRKRGQQVQLTSLNALYEPLYLKPDEVLWAHPVVRSLSD